MAALVMMSWQSMQAQNKTRERKPLTTEQKVERSVGRMTKELSLNEDQIQKITALYQEYFKSVEGLARGDEKMKEARQKLNEGIKAVLTEEPDTMETAEDTSAASEAAGRRVKWVLLYEWGCSDATSTAVLE